MPYIYFSIAYDEDGCMEEVVGGSNKKQALNNFNLQMEDKTEGSVVLYELDVHKDDLDEDVIEKNVSIWLEELDPEETPELVLKKREF
nr:MAG TPA: hypothetical protein [Caudoviricetes sp.]